MKNLENLEVQELSNVEVKTTEGGISIACITAGIVKILDAL